jgi:hypothetical protein
MTLRFSLVLVTAVTAVAIPIAGGAAYATTPIQAPATHQRTVALTTAAANVHIRSAAKVGKRSKILDTLHASGSTVRVSCYKTGVSVDGDTTWYRTKSPRVGYVAGHELSIAKEPASGVATCKTKK